MVTNAKTLHHLMRRLDEDDLHTICSYLADSSSLHNLEYGGLNGIGVASRSLSLIEYCRKRRAMALLIENLHEVREDILSADYDIWWAWAKQADSDELVSERPEQPGHEVGIETPLSIKVEIGKPAIPAVTIGGAAATLVEQEGNTEAVEAASVPIKNSALEKRHLRDELIDELTIKMSEAQADGDWDRAIEAGESIMALEPSHQPTRVKLGLAYRTRGVARGKRREYKQAIDDFDHAIGLDTNDIAAYNECGLIYKRMGRYEQALADFSNVIELDPGFAAAYYNRALTYASMGKHKSSLLDLQKAAELGDKDAKAMLKK